MTLTLTTATTYDEEKDITVTNTLTPPDETVILTHSCGARYCATSSERSYYDTILSESVTVSPNLPDDVQVRPEGIQTSGPIAHERHYISADDGYGRNLVLVDYYEYSGAEDEFGTYHSDWMAMGIWLSQPPVEGDPAEINLFVDGSAPSYAVDISRVDNGEYKYSSDKVLALYANPDGVRVVGGRVTVTATFASADAYVEGEVDSFTHSGETLPGTVHLRRIDIDKSEPGGYFSGSAEISGTGAETDMDGGRWSGEFYGDPEERHFRFGLPPKRVAGTFGVSTGAGGDDAAGATSISGVFIADNEQ